MSFVRRIRSFEAVLKRHLAQQVNQLKLTKKNQGRLKDLKAMMPANCVLREFFQKRECCFANVRFSVYHRKKGVCVCEVRLSSGPSYQTVKD